MKIVSVLGSMILGMGVLAGCGSKALNVTADGSEKSFEPTSGILSATTKTFSEPDGKGGFKSTKASSHYLYLGNFAFKSDVTNVESKTTPQVAGNLRVSMSFIGKEGTEAGGLGKSLPLATGSYAAKAARFEKVEAIRITAFVDGKSKEYSFDDQKTDGTVTISSVDETSVAGEINIKDGKNAIVGSFKTKLSK